MVDEFMAGFRLCRSPGIYALPGVDTNLVVVHSCFVKLCDTGGVGVDVHPSLADEADEGHAVTFG